jgi:hypothetical protein
VQPTDATVLTGSAPTFSVTATGTDEERHRHRRRRGQ